jgi:hypothetical protein
MRGRKRAVGRMVGVLELAPSFVAQGKAGLPALVWLSASLGRYLPFPSLRLRRLPSFTPDPCGLV